MNARRSRLLLVGHGRMGRLVEALSPEYGFDVSGAIDSANAADEGAWVEADVAVDFSIANAVPGNVRRLSERAIPIVLGTTGWQTHEQEVRATVAQHETGVVAAPNFALGVNVFLALAERLGVLMAQHAEFGAWIHELHHSAKRDAPSGTALALKKALQTAGYTHPIDVVSTRAGASPGIHTIGFDAAAETITLTHTTRDRSVFARGALEAARWVQGRKGWFTMKDVLGL